MKKVIKLSILLCAFASLVACSNGGTEVTSSETTATTAVSQTTTTTQVASTTEAVATGYIRSIGMDGVAFRCLDSFFCESGYYGDLIKDNVQMVNVCGAVTARTMFNEDGVDISDTYAGNLDKVLDDVGVDFIEEVLFRDYFEGENTAGINVTSKSTEKIGDYDALKFTGTALNYEGKECYTHGYCFVIKDTAFILGGFVRDESQSQTDIDYITQCVDTMAHSVFLETF